MKVKLLITGFICILASIPMRAQYISSNVDHVAAQQILPGTSDNPVIRIEVVIGALSENLNALFISTGITTNPSAVITATNIYYTGGSLTYSTSQLYTGGVMLLGPGQHYFWVAYDIASTANTCDTIDAGCYTVYMGSGTQTPAVTNPPEFALIANCATGLSNQSIQEPISYDIINSELHVSGLWNFLYVISSRGDLVKTFEANIDSHNTVINLSILPGGMYIAVYTFNHKRKTIRCIKL